VDITLEKYVQGNIPTRGTITNWDSTGVFTVNDGFTLTDPNGTTVENEFEIADGAGDVNVHGLIDVQTLAKFKFLGAGVLRMYGGMAVAAGGVTDFGTGAIVFRGGATQSVVLGSNPHHVYEYLEDGGIVNYLDAWVATGNHSMLLRNSTKTTFLVGGAYGAALFIVTPIRSMGPTQHIIDSSDGVGSFNYVIGAASAIIHNLDVSNMNLTGDTQPISSITGTDGGNNNNNPPSLDGYQWLATAYPDPEYNYGSYGYGIGVGVSIGGGVAYELN